MHEEFEKLLASVQPRESLFNMARAMFKIIWDQRLKHTKSMTADLKIQIVKTDKQIEKLLDQLVDAGSTSVMKAYEKRIAKLENEKLRMRDKIVQNGRPKKNFDEMFELACAFLSNPLNIWASGKLEDQQTVLKLVFSGRLSYCKNMGFRTPKIALPFKVLGQFSESENHMAHRGSVKL